MVGVCGHFVVPVASVESYRENHGTQRLELSWWTEEWTDMASKAHTRLSVLLDWKHPPELRIQLCQGVLTQRRLPRTSMDQPGLQSESLPIQVQSVPGQRAVPGHFIHYFMAAAKSPDLRKSADRQLSCLPHQDCACPILPPLWVCFPAQTSLCSREGGLKPVETKSLR